MTTLGIIGTDESDVPLVIATLDDLMEKASEAEEDEFKLIVAVQEDSPEEVLVAIFEWLGENSLHYDIVRSPKADPGSEATENANKTIKASDPAARLVAEMIKGAASDTRLLVLMGDGSTMPDNVNSAMQKALEEKMGVYDLSEAGLQAITYEAGDDDDDDPEDDAAADDDEAAEGEDIENIDLEAAGTAADGGDVVAIGLLTELADNRGLDPDLFPTWIGLAESLFELVSSEAPPASIAYTRATLPKELKELRGIAKAIGIENFAKMSRAELTSAILGEEEPATAPQAAAKTPKASAQPKDHQKAAEDTTGPRLSNDAVKGAEFLGEIYRAAKAWFEAQS